MWGTDYPHPEGTWPNTVERLRKDFGDVPVEDTRLTTEAGYDWERG